MARFSQGWFAPPKRQRQITGTELLDGQIPEGPAAGLWGPVCINTKLLAALLEERTRHSDSYFKAKSELAKNKSAQKATDARGAWLQPLRGD